MSVEYINGRKIVHPSLDFVYDDGGRVKASYAPDARDCVVRAIAIATEKPYKEVYDDLNMLCKASRSKRVRGGSSRQGVAKEVYKKYLESLGWYWVPTMKIGSGCQVHMLKDELPPGRLVVRLSRHLSCVIDGVIHDRYNPSRGGSRAVYGYFMKGRNV